MTPLILLSLLLPLPPSPPPRSSLFPYTTLFRSRGRGGGALFAGPALRARPLPADRAFRVRGGRRSDRGPRTAGAGDAAADRRRGRRPALPRPRPGGERPRRAARATGRGAPRLPPPARGGGGRRRAGPAGTARAGRGGGARAAAGSRRRVSSLLDDADSRHPRRGGARREDGRPAPQGVPGAGRPTSPAALGRGVRSPRGRAHRRGARGRR